MRGVGRVRTCLWARVYLFFVCKYVCYAAILNYTEVDIYGYVRVLFEELLSVIDNILEECTASHSQAQRQV